jgi:D-beta-D-heptose 7-phosphate kinase/D-beta-D-heptose 1-phosphate adenosyltransferase
MKKEVVVAVSGGFDPVHIGHVRLFEAAKKCGDKLVVILNGDSWLIRKKGKYFMGQEERAEVIRAFSSVDDVFVWESEENDVCGALQIIKPDIFANGGDRRADNIPEYDFCRAHGIEMRFNVGLGGKVQSSSSLLARYTGERSAKRLT